MKLLCKKINLMLEMMDTPATLMTVNQSFIYIPLYNTKSDQGASHSKIKM